MIDREARDEGRRAGEFETTLALAEALGLPPETRIGPALAEVRRLRAERDALVRARAHIEALESYIHRVHTCVACECALVPCEAPPHCEDSCAPSDEQAIAWEEAYLYDPVAHFRAEFGAPRVAP